MGYHRAGFDVVGVDNVPQPNYPFEHHVADALDFPLDGFDAVHASPPCQHYIRGGLVDRAKHPDLLGPTRDRLRTTGVPWVIENVPGAPMRVDIQLCGSAFGLAVRRHRWFEFDRPRLSFVPPCDHSRPVAGVYGHMHGEGGAAPGMLPSTLASWSAAMGIDWMAAHELAEAIPPAYCQFIGEQLIGACRAAA